MNADQVEALRRYRESKDPLRTYKPRPTQDAFMRSFQHHKLLMGANRSGKTSAGLADIAMKLRNIHPYQKWVKPIRVWLWCQSRSQASAVIGRKLFEKSELFGELENEPMIPAWEIKELGSLKVGGIRVYQRAVLHNGSECLFGWSGVESSWKRFGGGQYDIVGFDEASCEGDLLNESLTRVADQRAKYAANEAESWRGSLYWYSSGTQVDANFEKFRDTCKDVNFPDWGLYQIPVDERSEEMARVMSDIGSTMTEEQRHIRIDGDSTATQELQIYARQWSDARHMRPDDYLVQPTDNLWCVYDPGVDHPTGIGFAAINAQNPIKIRFVRFFNQRRLTLEDEVEIIAGYLRGRVLTGLVYDVSAHKTEKTGLSVKNQLSAILQRRGVTILRGLIAGRNRHKDGITRVRHYLDPNPNDAFAEPLIEFNPSAASGCMLMRQQMLKYRSYEAGKYTGIRGVVKKEDEACFAAGTEVQTISGPLPIEKINPGDVVWTRSGWRRALGAGCTSLAAEVFKVRTSDGRSVVATANHRFWVAGRGWTRMDSIRYGDTIESWSKTSYTQGKNTTRSDTSDSDISKTEMGNFSTGLSTPPSAGQSLRSLWSITRMATHGTMTSTTWRQSPRHVMRLATIERHQRSRLSRQRGGTQPLPGAHGTHRTSAMCCLTEYGMSNATFAGTNFSESAMLSQGDFVQTTASQHGVAGPGLMTSTECAPSVAWGLGQTATLALSAAPACAVVSIERVGVSPVYDLTVDGAHEFLANGYVAHNCDVVRYLCSATPAYDRAAACGYEVAPATDMAPIPTQSDLLLAQREERSRKLWEMIEERDNRQGQGISLW